MKAQFYEDFNEFYNIAFPFLLKREAENNLLLSILNALKENIYRYGKEFPLLFVLTKNGAVKLIALRTPPHDLLISYTDDLDTIEILVEELLQREENLPGVLSFKEAADKFVKLWAEKNSLNLKLIRKERIYKLEKVAKNTLGNQRFALALNTHQSLVLKWAKEFMQEALVELGDDAIESNLINIKRDLKKESRIYLLFDQDNPVSMVRKAGKTPNGNFVNLVYTPPSLRRKGYATECVAKLSQRLLDEGNKYCFLFTDLSNPTSNSIYLKIGYRPVIDENHYKFMPK